MNSLQDGNLCRRMYSEFSEIFSELTSIPISIIKAYWVIYICLASRRIEVDPEKFEVYCDLLREEWDKEMPWYPWCVSMHHWQVHAAEIMRILPPTICVAMLNEVCICSLLHRGAFCQFPFQWIYYNGSNKSTGKESDKMHLCVLV